LRASKLAAVAIPRLSTGSSAPFLAAPFFRARLLGAAAIDSTWRVLD